MQAIQITDGRTSLWQWDTGVRVKVYGCTDVDQMHFVTPGGIISRDLVDGECGVPDANVSSETANQALYLIKIVETIQAANPGCFILVCGVFASKADVVANNDVVQQIAAKYGLHYVDTMELSTSVKPELHAGIANVHFGKAGNIYIANKFANEIRSIICENPVLAEFGLTNRTN